MSSACLKLYVDLGFCSLSLALLAGLTVGAVSCKTSSSSWKQEKSEAEVVSIAGYQSEAEALLQLVHAARTSPPLRSEYIRSIAYGSERLMQMGIVLAKDYVQSHSECTEYLQAAMQLPEELDQLTLREIRLGYQKDQRLEGFVGSSKPQCQHIKNLLVHPAAVLAISNSETTSTGDFDRMSSEIHEVIAHSRFVTM